ncbi:MAG: hypothetical protein JWM19_753 [Actinomycetia bacterium]|nr:hypothetical protein [Actinomycetes bacterium]
MNAGIGRTLFRAYARDEFFSTPCWAELEHIFTGTGGAYGIYGPRGAGKSWLMQRAIDEVGKTGGMGLWFPCPSGDDTAAILSSLSDNLANAVERRYKRDNPWWAAMRWLRYVLAVVIAVPIVAAVVSYAAHGLGSKLQPSTLFGTLPGQLWDAVGAAIGALCMLAVASAIQAGRPSGRLARDATALRERIRYTTALKFSAEADVSAGTGIAGTIRQSREKDLDERPTTVASLVFDFRRLAELIVATTKGSLVIGIDELDKIDDPDAARKLLRDIKGIFEIPGVFFLVSVSEEAAGALQLGPLQGTGRNEFNSSFYTVIELPALGPSEIGGIAADRGLTLEPSGAQLLCLLSAGNWRELIKTADRWPVAPGTQRERGSDRAGQLEADRRMARRVLRNEANALQREIVRAYGGASAGGDVISVAWAALPEAAFEDTGELDALCRNLVRRCWNLVGGDPIWDEKIAEPWRRFLIRLFVVGRVMATMRPAVGLRPAAITGFTAEHICDLRDVLIMAGHSAPVALLMLKARFGEDLASPYAMPPGP